MMCRSEYLRRVPAWPIRRTAIASGLAVALLVLVGQAEAWTVDLEGGSRAVTAACALLATAAVALRRRSPAASALLVVGALVAKDALGGADELVVLLLCGVVTAFAVGALEPSPRSELALAALLMLAAVAVMLGESGAPSELLFSALALGAPWGAGRLVRDRTERAGMLEELAIRREHETRDRVRLAAAEERTRIARELHDLVGHSVSLMVLQAGAAEQLLRERPDAAIASLVSLQATGRSAVDELRRALGLLRDDAGSGALEPLPGIDELDAFLGRVRGAGIPVELRVEGDPVPLPDGVSLAAFRILQEALTNVVKHAGDASARVLVAYAPDLLRLEVVDDGDARAAGPSGHGLVGIRERVAMYSGRLEVGPRPDGGFGVAAELPLGGPGA